MGPWSYANVITVLPSLAIILLVSFALGYLLRNKSELIRIIPIGVIVMFLFGLEIFKQVYFLTNYNSAGQIYWDSFTFPLHYSSLCVWLGPIYVFYTYDKKNTFSNIINSFFYIYTFVSTLAMLVAPNGIYGQGSLDRAQLFFQTYECKYFSGFHTIIYHNLVVFIFFLLLFLRLLNKDIKHNLLYGLPPSFCYLLLEAIVSYATNTNFNNFLFCSIPFVENVRVLLVNKIGNLGQFIYVVFIMFCLMSLSTATVFLLNPIMKSFDKGYCFILKREKIRSDKKLNRI